MKILFLFSSTPHASIQAQEGLDALLMGSAFAQCAAVFLGDAIWQLVDGQRPEQVGRKNFALGFAALKEYGVTDILCNQNDLAAAGLTVDALSVDITSATDADIREVLQSSDRILTF